MKLGKDPWKLYGITVDGNGNELQIFISAFRTKEEAEQYPINEEEFHGRWVGIEEDF
jgi:hypothetical protein